MQDAKQVTLPLNPTETFSFDNFYFGPQREAEQAITRFSHADGVAYLYLCAPAGEGKSHLLMAAMHAAKKSGKHAAYFPLDVLVKTTSPAILDGIEQADLVCLDALDAIAGQLEWEEAIFHCFNRLQQAGTSLLVAASALPSELGLSLADLRSRLDTGTLYQLMPLQDSDKQQALMKQAAYRGLILPAEVAHYLLRHYGRDMASLMGVLQDLDKASLAAQRRLTIPFVKQAIH